MKKPKWIDLSPEELDALLERVESGELQPGDAEVIRAMAETIAYLSELVDQKNTSVKRLLKTLFGSGSEKLKKILPEESEEPGGPAAQSSASQTEDPKKKKKKGHGRNGADKYQGAERIDVPHPQLSHGDSCPKDYCGGKVYKLRVPAVVVRVRGQAPLSATVLRRERLRCNLCLEIFTAPMPEGFGDKKYDETAASMIALLKYGSGLPFNRMEKLEGNLGIPLSASTQWDIVDATARELSPIYDEFILQAASGAVIHNDDTPARILQHMGKRREEPGEEALGNSSAMRSGLYTTGIVSVGSMHHIVLFFTGKKHAGENLESVLKKRARELEAPIQMSDALSHNTCGDFETVLSNCLGHGRRQFVDVVENFPQECRRVLETLAEVYHNDAVAKERGLGAKERLRFHREHSRPLMVSLRCWFRELLLERRVEPNSDLGKAIAYMKKHWLKLTLFYRRAGAPLDNSICERALKKVILHRKNALFFRSDRGAKVGDLFMSLIHTAELAGENPFEYLTELQRNAPALRKSPSQWLPWNYRQTLAGLPDEPA